MSPRGRRTLRLAAAGAAALLGACATGGVPVAEIPDAPIAIRYRTPEEARHRAEAYEDRQRDHSPAAAAGGITRVGETAALHTDLGTFESYLGDVLGRRDEDPRRYAGRLALLDPRTREVHVVQGALRGAIPLDWSADRTRLLYAQPEPHGSDVQLWELRLADRSVRPVTYGPPLHSQGCYGPDGRIVALAVDTRSDPARSWVTVSQTGGRGPYVRLSEGPADFGPACSPDGSVLAFARADAQHRLRILVRSPLVAGPTRPLVPGRDPRFSADGEWIVYAAPHARETRLFRVRPDGSGRAPIGAGRRSESSPATSPDDRLVVYVAAEKAPRRHLYLRRFDGSGDRILFADGDGEFPVW